MKLNNKGFAISTIMYMILIMAVILIVLTLTLLSNRKLILDKTKEEVKENIYSTSTLPYFYQQVKYIESDGAQAIRGIYQVPQNYTSIKFVTKTNTNSTAEQGVIGITKTLELGYSSKINRVILWDSTSSSLAYTSSTDILNKDIIMEASLIGGNSKNFRLNQEEIQTALMDYTSINGKSVDLFVYTGSENYYFTGKMYYAKIYVDDNLARDLVPCYRKTDGVIGMYDFVSGNFYVNNEAGTFIKGYDVK